MSEPIMRRHPALKYLRLKEGSMDELPSGATVEPQAGFSFATCANCGCPHWLIITPVPGNTVVREYDGKPPVAAYICRNCLLTLDEEPP